MRIPTHWTRSGLILPRTAQGDGSHVVGDPCVVFDPAVDNWRMFLFYDPPGHGHAVCTGPDPLVAGAWRSEGRLAFTNPEAAPGGTHKPYVVMDAHRPNHAAVINGRYCLVSVSWTDGHKVAQQAWASSLAGPWTWEPDLLMPLGAPGEFDDKHIDAISGLYFPDRAQILFFYMGYPSQPQPHAGSPLGSSQALAVQNVGEPQARKLGVLLAPSAAPDHWASGWVGGMQVLAGTDHRWIAIVNASPTAPSAADKAISREEPPPSLGGFAFCDEEWPDRGWHWCDEPIEWIEQIPPAAIAHGEGVNLWRQHIVVLPDGRIGLFYNSGAYGKEQLYAKWASRT